MSVLKIQIYHFTGDDARFIKTRTPHNHRHYEIILFQKGTGVRHVVDFRVYDELDQSIFFLQPHQVHYFEPNAPRIDFSAYLLRLPSAITNTWVLHKTTQRLFAGVLHDARISFPDPLMCQLVATIRSFYGENKQVGEAFLHYLTAIAYRQLRDSHVVESASEGKELFFYKFSKIVEEQLRATWRVGDYARAMGLSEKQLHRQISRFTHQTPFEYIQNRLNIEAKRLLYVSNLSIKEISYKLGFKRPARFNEFFRRLNGESPSVFRATKRSPRDSKP